jgi:hypothetical protein
MLCQLSVVSGPLLVFGFWSWSLVFGLGLLVFGFPRPKAKDPRPAKAKNPLTRSLAAGRRKSLFGAFT